MTDKYIAEQVSRYKENEYDRHELITKIWDYNHSLYYQLIERVSEEYMATICAKRFGGTVSSWFNWINSRMWNLLGRQCGRWQDRDERLVHINQALRYIKHTLYTM